MSPQEMQFIKIDKYRDKPIRFYDKNDHYDLIFCSDFQGANQQSPIYSQLLLDLKDADKSKEIHLWIHSHGGDCSTLMMINQQLNEFEYVVTIGLGQIDSAGFMLWCQGDERYLSPLTLCMYHSLSTGNYGKAKQMKEYSDFMTKYQSIFENIARKILTDEQLEKGRYTEIWLLGQQLIDRKKCFDYKNYSNRNVLQKIQAFKINNEIYLKDTNKNYVQVLHVGSSLKKNQLMQKHSQMVQKCEQIYKHNDQFDEQFADFMFGWFDTKENIFNNDGFISNSYLIEQWQLYSPNKKTLEQLKEKIELWIKTFYQDLQFVKEKQKGSKKGFVIKLKNEKDTDKN